MNFAQFPACLVRILVVSGWLLAVGCSSQPPALVPASGKVVLANGKPLAGVVLTFCPQDNPKSFDTLPFCFTGPEGEFQVLMGAKLDHGLPPGRYRVMIFSPNRATAPLVPAPYTDHQTTPLEVIVPKTGKTDILLRVE